MIFISGMKHRRSRREHRPFPYIFLFLSAALLLGFAVAIGCLLPAHTHAAQSPTLSEREAGIRQLPARQQFKEWCLLARNYEKQKIYDEAARFFLQAAEVRSVLADAVLDEAARMHMAAKNYPAAIASLQRIITEHSSSPIRFKAYSRMATAYQDAGNFADALAVHQQAINRVTGSASRDFHRIMTAELLEKLQRKQEAAKLFNTILQTPNRYSIRALEGYHRVKLAGRTAARAEHAAAVGLQYYKAEAYQQAGPALDLAIRLKSQLGKKSSEMIDLIEKAAHSLYTTHNNEMAAAYYEILLPLMPEKLADHHYFLGRLYTRLGVADKARKHYGQLLKVPNAGGYRLTALYQLNLLNIEDEQYGKAYAYFNQRAQRQGGDRELIYWLAAWSAYRAGKNKAALTYFDKLDKLRRLRDPERYRYWRARILLETGKKNEGLAILSALNRSHPVSYHGWRSAELLKKYKRKTKGIADGMDHATPNGFDITTINSGWWRQYPELAGLDRVIDLADADLWRTAGLEIARFEVPKKITPRHGYELAQLALNSRAYHRAGRIASKANLYSYLRKSRQPLLTTYYPLRMPLGYEEYVLQYATEYRLPPAFVFAVILNESAYQPEVVSPAFAIGLMQILPQTGEQIATALGETYHEDSLYDPETNIRYGCWYLRHLLDQLGEDPAYAIAAYNAGPKAVGKWLRKKKDEPQEIFIAEIPYQETNRYVRKVMTAYRKYEVMLSNRPIPR